MLLVPLAALANFFSLVETFFSAIGAGFISISNDKSSCDLTRFSTLCSSSLSDLRFSGLIFSNPK